MDKHIQQTQKKNQKHNSKNETTTQAAHCKLITELLFNYPLFLAPQ